ncbi:hypothetical protein [Streptomyces sp. NPDC002520]
MSKTDLLTITVMPVDGDEETADRVLTNMEMASRAAGNDSVRRAEGAETAVGAKSGWGETLSLLIGLSPYARVGVELVKIIGLSMRRRHVSRITLKVRDIELEFDGPLTADQQAMIERLIKESEGEPSDGEGNA